MKYIILCTVALVVCIGAGLALSKLLLKHSYRPGKGWKTLLLTVLFSVVIMALVSVGYMSVHYSAADRAETALAGTAEVTVEKVKGGYFFDGAGSECALVFYPGAKVECEAYASLMLAIAEQGVDCFLADMPFNFAIFGKNAATSLLEGRTYDTVLLAGHSLGGLIASSYAAEHSDTVDGVVLLAAYPTVKIADGQKLLSVYGTEDGCLNREEYEKDKDNWPADAWEVTVDGANHAGFGDYGSQKGDGIATVTNAEQQSQTAWAIAAFFLQTN